MSLASDKIMADFSDGLVLPQELPLSPQHQLISAVDYLAQEHRGHSNTPQVLEHQGNTRDLPQHLVASLLVLEYLDNILLHQELQASFPPVPGRLDSSLGSIHLKELPDSYPEVLLLIQQDRFRLALVLPLALIQTCLSLVGIQQEAMGCMDQEVKVDFLLQLDQDLSQHSQEVDSPQYHLGHGDHQEEVSRLPLALLRLALGPWVHMVDLLVQEAHCPDIIHHFIESNDLNFSVGQGHHIQPHHAMVPYDLPLHAGIMPRLLITVIGEPVPGAGRFQVDLIKGSDVVFHFNPRFNEQTIVRNSNLGGYWGPEEREGPFPFVQGRQFELKILVEEDMFKVAVDGTHLLEYEHRVGGLEEVTLLRVTGDIILYSAAPSMI
ncbi:hypothetical protein CRENBAI_008337 [Crenichthys baileyi]|uniref:Galectin n=1 Tax=Crenichthys baileyi TaxID=28760 RepID=A0AAV9SEC3_9TELE